MNNTPHIVANFRSQAESVSAWVLRCATNPDCFDVLLRDDRGTLLERVCALSLHAAVTKARAMSC